MEEAITMLKSANFEIRNLRKQNELMRARLDMFDSINAILNTKIATQSYGESPDLCFSIDKFIESNKKQNGN